MYLTLAVPKLPMRNKEITRKFYLSLGFKDIGSQDYPDYFLCSNHGVELHFFIFKDLNPELNYGQVYFRVNHIDELYHQLLANNISIHPNGKLVQKPWGQKEFSILDPDNNLLTFGESF